MHYLHKLTLTSQLHNYLDVNFWILMGSVPPYTDFASTSPTLSRIFSDSVITAFDSLSAANNTLVDATLNKLFTYLYHYIPLTSVGNIIEVL